ncbi:hypothetical protein ASE00_07615 [Sphingomonas sp. Root710]|uniref:tetratricopeptide repeat protein n=1 Tax=Sphingomonas sp. Root710 TaxID=1736594 RepID=UPI0006F9D2A0|nr:glycosyltransferase family 41 protein [Sphingomonas sp. Root710]KRB86551.1 hypothetical protein ASE00_07615 [Sphingomonas sp. Root710]
MTNMSLEINVSAKIQMIVAAFSQGRYEEALRELDPLMQIVPDQPALYNIAGAAYAGTGQLEQAITRYDRAIALQPDFADAYSNRGLAFREQGKALDALASFDMAIQCNPGLADAYSNRGILLNDLGRTAEAIESYDRAISLMPIFPVALYNRANALVKLRRYEDALASFDQAIAQKPDYAEALCNRGNVLHELGRLKEAVDSLDRAIAIKPDYAAAYSNRGNVLHETRQLDVARISYEKAISLVPDDAETLGRLAFLKAHMCDWHTLRSLDIPALGIRTAAITPFNMLALDDDAGRQLKRSRKWAETKYTVRKRPSSRPRAADAPIRIGYFSADFHNHATMWLVHSLFAAHDRSRFEIHAFSYGPDRQDFMRRRVIDTVDHFHDVRCLNDEAIATRAQAACIDIAVDLKGYTQDTRSGIFAHGAAPIQVAYLGYPGSMGADFIDYIVADAIVIPPDLRRHYSEKLICLPASYQVNDDRRPTDGKLTSRADEGLPEEGFVFCCFNNSYKFSPDSFDVWMRLLTSVDGSVLWLLQDNEWVVGNLRREARDRGVDPDRIIFAERAVLADHLARHRHADLFLDTFACNAHTTASDALWAGVPVVTKLGNSFASRVAGSLLHTVGLPELATDSVEAYESLALSLASDPARLGVIKARLAAQRSASPLFNTMAFTRHLERGFIEAFDRQLRSLPPDHIIL